MGTQLRNPHQSPVTLPYPLRGILAPGQSVTLNLTEKSLRTILSVGGALPPLDIFSVLDTRIDTAAQGDATDADPLAMTGILGSIPINNGAGGLLWGPFGMVAKRWEFRAGLGASISLFGVAVNTSGTITGVATIDGTPYRRSSIVEYLVTTPAANSFARLQANNDQLVYRDGFDVWWYGGFPDVTAGQAAMNCVATSAGVTTAVQPSAFTNFVGIGFDATDANFQAMQNDASGTATKVDTGIPRPSVIRDELYLMRIRKLPGAVPALWAIRRMSDGLSFSGVMDVSNAPVISSVMRQQCLSTNPGASTTTGIGVGSMGGIASI